MYNNGILVRKILARNLHTGNVTITDQEMSDYYAKKFKELHVCDENGVVLEKYYGAGLQRLIESARKKRLNDEYLLAKRYFMSK
jgi:hypothetical protein